MHRNAPFRDINSKNFLGRGHSRTCRWRLMMLLLLRRLRAPCEVVRFTASPCSCSQLQFVNCFYSFNEWMNEWMQVWFFCRTRVFAVMLRVATLTAAGLVACRRRWRLLEASEVAAATVVDKDDSVFMSFVCAFDVSRRGRCLSQYDDFVTSAVVHRQTLLFMQPCNKMQSNSAMWFQFTVTALHA